MTRRRLPAARKAWSQSHSPCVRLPQILGVVESFVEVVDFDDSGKRESSEETVTATLIVCSTLHLILERMRSPSRVLLLWPGAFDQESQVSSEDVSVASSHVASRGLRLHPSPSELLPAPAHDIATSSESTALLEGYSVRCALCFFEFVQII